MYGRNRTPSIDKSKALGRSKKDANLKFEILLIYASSAYYIVPIAITTYSNYSNRFIAVESDSSDNKLCMICEITKHRWVKGKGQRARSEREYILTRSTDISCIWMLIAFVYRCLKYRQ